MIREMSMKKMTQLQLARQNIITREMKQVATDECLEPEYIRERIAEGKIVIPANHKRTATRVCGIGTGLKPRSMPISELQPIMPILQTNWKSCRRWKRQALMP